MSVRNTRTDGQRIILNLKRFFGKMAKTLSESRSRYLLIWLFEEAFHLINPSILLYLLIEASRDPSQHRHAGPVGPPQSSRSVICVDKVFNSFSDCLNVFPSIRTSIGELLGEKKSKLIGHRTFLRIHHRLEGRLLIQTLCMVRSIRPPLRRSFVAGRFTPWSKARLF